MNAVVLQQDTGSILFKHALKACRMTPDLLISWLNGYPECTVLRVAKPFKP